MALTTMRVWYDHEGDFLEIIFYQAKGYLQEIAEDIYERVDESGNVLGYALFNVSLQDRQHMVIPLDTRRLQALMQDS